jgi:Protein of unknown function (DUF1573)
MALLLMGNIALGGAAYYYFADAHESTTPNVATSNVDEHFVDLGTIWAQRRYYVEIPVRNKGTTALTILNFRPSCSCTKIEPESLTVPAGTAGTLRAELDLAANRAEEYQVPARAIEVEIRANTSGERPRELLWKLRATVRNAIGLNPIVVVQDLVVIGADAPMHSVQIVEHAPLQSLVASCDPKRAEVQVARVPGEGRLSQLDIRLKPGETPGSFEFPIVLTPVAEDNKTSIPPVKIHIRGLVVEDIYATPSIFAVGILQHGQHLETNAVLASRQQRAFEITDIHSSDPSIQAAPEERGGSSQSTRIRITSEPLPSGKLNAFITVSAVDSLSERRVQIVLPLTGYVLPPSRGDGKETDAIKFEAGSTGSESKECK